MTITYFITGTDTNIGKTTSALKLINFYQAQQKTVLGLKPVATGSEYNNNTFYNTDAALLQQASNLQPLYKHVNPYLFDEPVSPHIVNTTNISACTIANACKKTIKIYNPDYCLIEGAGGWFCPLNATQSFADIAEELTDLNIAIILVVGIKLGCLNHAILTSQAIKSSKIKLHGWIANHLQPQNNISKSNVDYLIANINADLIMEIPYDESNDDQAHLSKCLYML
jgi:dethiobiotin synthetase